MTFKYLLCLILLFKFGQNVVGVENGTRKSLPQGESGDASESLLGHHFVNLTRCSHTQLNLSKESLDYNWDLKGFLDYYIFMKKFEQVFEVKTEEINFKSDIVDGKWYFKIIKVITPGNTPSEDIIVSSTYSYEAKQPKKLHFYVKLSLIHNKKEIVLPIQKSTNAMVMQQRLYNRRGYSSYLEYVHTFTWPSLGSTIESILKLSTSSRLPDSSRQNGELEEDESFIGEDGRLTFKKESEDVTLRFKIIAYFPTDPVFTGSENCQHLLKTTFSEESEGLVRDGESSSPKTHAVWKYGIPPYVKHANSMLHDVKYSDVILKVKVGDGDQLFTAHRIILSTSSPVFSAMLYNSTDLVESTNEILFGNSNGTSINRYLTELNLGESLSAEVAEELLRYIYTGMVSYEKMADKLILAAHKYELPELKKLCERYLLPRIKTENAIQMYTVGHEVGSSKIVRRALAIMKANKTKLVTQSAEFQRLSIEHPGLMYELFVSP